MSKLQPGCGSHPHPQRAVKRTGEMKFPRGRQRGRLRGAAALPTSSGRSGTPAGSQSPQRWGSEAGAREQRQQGERKVKTTGGRENKKQIVAISEVANQRKTKWDKSSGKD